MILMHLAWISPSLMAMIHRFGVLMESQSSCMFQSYFFILFFNLHLIFPLYLLCLQALIVCLPSDLVCFQLNFLIWLRNLTFLEFYFDFSKMSIFLLSSLFHLAIYFYPLWVHLAVYFYPFWFYQGVYMSSFTSLIIIVIIILSSKFYISCLSLSSWIFVVWLLKYWDIIFPF
jgi:hypothetical protein